MNRPFRTKLHHIADLALAFCTLEAVRLPALRDAGAGPDAHGTCRAGRHRCDAPARSRTTSTRRSPRRTAPVAVAPDVR